MTTDTKGRGGLKAHMANLSSAILGEEGAIPARERRARGSGAMGAPTEMAVFSADYQNLERQVETLTAEKTRLEAEKGKVIRVPIALCDDGDFHATPVDPARVEELKPNLKARGQASPATVRLKADGRYEIAMGRHRKYALLALGHEEWDVVVRDMDDDTAQALSFYDNLWSPNISDYTKFCGLSERKARMGLTIEGLAEESGISKSLVGNLLSFGKLPAEALSVVAANPKQFGANMVAKLAGLVDGHAEHVTAIVKLVADGTVRQDQAPAKVLELAGAAAGKASKKSAPTRVAVEWEGRSYATIDVRAKTLTIKLEDKGEAEAAAEAVRKALENRAKKAHP